ncbi:glycosyltransferase family 4 protein [Gottfriedia acidiceleris]|uniref:glycosyltransferase family 4 protein n=1 Tax=Gottfriedia acidiceleris TaxID=371036 RepID=UPI00101CD87A|nr:glycosyltransferase family 4 protein [Gottfriedia acidiceleris]
MNKKTKVLLITQHFYPEIGSAANRLKNIYLELKEKGYEVKVLTLHPRYPSREIYNNQAFWNEPFIDEKDVNRIDPSIKNHSGSIIKRLYLYLEVMVRFIIEIFKYKREFNIVFVTSPPIFVGIAGLISKWRLRAPLILDIRDLWPESLRGVNIFSNKLILSIAYKVESLLYKKANKIIINSRSFKEYMVNKGVKESKISFLPNSLTEDELNFTPVNDEPDNEKINIIYTGNLGLAQDLDKFLKASIQMKECKDFHFIIVGYGKNVNEVKNYIKEHQLTNVTLYSAKSRTETLSLVSKSDITYVSLVDQEVFKTVLPGKIIDYMCLKKPIIGNVAGYAAQIIKDANCGTVLEEGTEEELVRHIKHLATDQLERNMLGENGYLYAYKNLRWKTNIYNLINVMEEIHE